MSSGFVSGGTIDQPIERDAEWLKAQQELEDTRRAKAELAKQQDGKSLFEILEQNKAAKQDAFEESIKLKNQFRSLDEDEVEFLDTVLESTRAKEKAVREETKVQLEAFRKQREEEAQRELEKSQAGAGGQGAGSPTEEEIFWAASGKKRKRAKEKGGLKGVKLQRSESKGEEDGTKGKGSLTKEATTSKDSSAETQAKASTVQANNEKTAPSTTDAAPKTGLRLGLGAYDSDSES